MLVNNISISVSNGAAREAADDLAIVKRLGIVTVEKHLSEFGIFLENLECWTDVRSPGKKVPVVFQVHEPRRAHGLSNQVETACVTSVGPFLFDEFEERESSLHLVAIFRAGVVVNADELVDEIEVAACIDK